MELGKRRSKEWRRETAARLRQWADEVEKMSWPGVRGKMRAEIKEGVSLYCPLGVLADLQEKWDVPERLNWERRSGNVGCLAAVWSYGGEEGGIHEEMCESVGTGWKRLGLVARIHDSGGERSAAVKLIRRWANDRERGGAEGEELGGPGE